jgi:hypothetical protein
MTNGEQGINVLMRDISKILFPNNPSSNRRTWRASEANPFLTISALTERIIENSVALLNH